MRGWLFILGVLVSLAVLLCSITPPASAFDFGDGSQMAASADSSCDWSGGPSPDHDPDAPPRVYDPADAGTLSDVSASFPDASEEPSSDEHHAEAEAPSDGSASSPEIPEEPSSDEHSGEAGIFLDGSSNSPEVPEEPSSGEYSGEAPWLNPGDYAPTVENSLSTEEFPAPQEETPAENPESSSGNDADSSTMEDTQEVTATDIQEFKDYLETLHFDVWTMLFSLWGFAGIFLGYKVGGVVLGRL